MLKRAGEWTAGCRAIVKYMCAFGQVNYIEYKHNFFLLRTHKYMWKCIKTH